MHEFIERDVKNEEWFIKKREKVERCKNVEKSRTGNKW